MAKDKKTIKYEADISGFKSNIQEAEKNIKTLNNQLKLNQAQLKGNSNSVELLGQRVEQLKEKHKEQTTVVENTRKEYEKAVEVYGENSTEAENLKNKLIQAETKQQSTANAIKETNNQLTLQTDKLITTGSKMQDFGDSTKKVGDNINSIGNKVSVASAGVGTLGVAAVKTTASFESSMRKVAATMGITAKEIENGSESYKILEEAAQKCGETTKYSASEAADALNYLALAGYDAKKSAEVLPKVLNLAAAGDLDLAVASDMVTDAMAALNLETKDLDRYINEMAKTAQKSNTNVAQLGEGTLTVAGTAKLANMSLETMNAELGILANNGIKGAEGGTHLRNIILSLTSPTDAAAIALKKLGINVSDNKGNIRDLNDIMSDFNTKLNGLSDEKKTNIISTIFNKTDISAVNALIKGSGEEFTNLKNEISNCGNAAQDMADVMNSSLEGQTTLLKSQIESIAISTGKKLMPTAKKAVEEISKLATSFSKLSDEQVESIVKTGAFVVALGPALKIGGKAISTIGSGVRSIGTLTKAIGVMKTGVNSGIGKVDSLAKTFVSLSNPMAAIITLTGTLTLAMIAAKAAQMQEQNSLEGLREEVENQKESWNNLAETRRASLSSSMTEISICQNLRNELSQITDENGKVKKGYEQRAEVILTTLNNALGTEYKLNGNIINQYQDLKNNIDNVITAKKAEAVLNAYQAEYETATREQTKATEALIGLKKQQTEVSKKLIAGTYEERIEAQQTLSVIGDKIKEQNDLIGMYGKTVQDYENLQRTSIEGSAEAITKAISEIGASYDSLKETAGKSTIEQINAQQEYVNAIKSALQEAKDQHNEYQQKILESQLTANEQQLTNLENSLSKQTNTIQELTPQQIEAWKQIAERSTMEYGHLLAQVPEETRREIQNATGVVALNTSLSAQFGTTAINASNLFRDNLDTSNIAKNKILDTSTVIQNDTSVNLASSSLAQSANRGFNENADGLTLGNNLSSNIASGLSSSKSKTMISNAISTLSGWISSRLSTSMNINVASASILPGHKNGLDYVPYDNYVARLHKGERVLTAEENKRYVNENINNKLVERSIIMNFYPQSMSETEMKRTFDYVDRRLGKIY